MYFFYPGKKVPQWLAKQEPQADTKIGEYKILTIKFGGFGFVRNVGGCYEVTTLLGFCGIHLANGENMRVFFQSPAGAKGATRVGHPKIVLPRRLEKYFLK